MLKLRDGVKVYVKRTPIDLRKAINGLTVLVLDEFHLSPQSGHIFVFFNKGKDKVKLLVWDRNGFVLYYKRLERHKFCLPSVSQDAVLEISEVQLQGLLIGLDFMLLGEFQENHYHTFY